MNKAEIHLYAYKVLIVTCICALPFSKWLSSFSVILMAVNWLAEGGFKNKLLRLCGNLPAMLMIAFFFCCAAGIFFTSHVAVCQFSIQKKLSFLAMGIVLGSVSVFDKFSVRQLLWWFTASLLVASAYCFFIAVWRHHLDHSPDHFFYHSLGSAIDFHAVYFSVWIYIALFFIVIELLSPVHSAIARWSMLLIFCWFSAFLILLSSKLVIVLFLISLLMVLLFNIARVKSVKPLLISGLVILSIATGILSTNNEVSRRFDDIRNQNISLLNNGDKEFSPAIYFNGLALRLLLWEYGLEILHENHAWLFGVSGGDSQALLNEKIIKAHMYTGEPGGKSQGYLNYNFHNEFIETLVQSGICGLFILLSLFAALLYLSIQRRDLLFFLFLIMFLCFFCTESVLEGQKGVVPFVLFGLIFTGLGLAERKAEI